MYKGGERMKRISYKEVTNVSIQNIKKFALAIALKRGDYYVIKKVNMAVSLEQIKRLLVKDIELTDYFLKQSISCLENAETFEEFETIIVYMNILLPNNNNRFIEFKSNLYWWIINQIDGVFRYEHYAIIRHLKKLSRSKRKELIESIWQLLDKQNEQYHKCCLEIYLVEEDYENAYQHIPYIQIDKTLEHYKPLLMEYDSKEYKKHFHVKQNSFYSKLSSFVEKVILTCL